MRISYSRSDIGSERQRYAIDNLASVTARLTASADSPWRPGESFDVRVRRPNWESTNPDEIQVREWDRARGVYLSPNVLVVVDRLHIY